MRYFELLAEDAASDRTQRNHARRILRDIAARLLEAEPRKAVWTTYRGRNRTPIELPLGYTTLADLGMPKYSDLAIGYMGAYGSMSGSIIDLNQARKIGEGVPFPDTIRYFIAYPVSFYPNFPNVPPNFIMLQGICQRGSQTLLHELIHYLDKHRGVPLAGAKTTADYYNDPSEMNAYYQMAVAAVDKRPAAWFAEPAKRWLSKALQTFEKAFLAALTPANRNRLLKRLYGLWTSRQKCELPRP